MPKHTLPRPGTHVSFATPGKAAPARERPLSVSGKKLKTAGLTPGHGGPLLAPAKAGQRREY